MVSLGFGSCNLRAVLTGGDAGQAPVDAVCYASGLFRAPPFSLIDETRGSDRSVPVWVGMRFGKHLISRPVLGIGKEKTAHEAGQVSGISLVKYRDWMGVNLVVGNG